MSKKGKKKQQGKSQQPSTKPQPVAQPTVQSAPTEENKMDKTATTQANAAKPAEYCGCAEHSEERRSFCKSVVAAGIAAAAVAPPVVAGVRVVLSAPEQKGKEARFFQLATIDTLTKTPQKFLISDDTEDAWMLSPQQKIGAVFLSLNDEGNVHAIQSLCPHAGCTVEVSIRENPKTKIVEPIFYCPCHVASFDLFGVRLDEKSQSPRDLDTLEVKVEDGKVFVKFEKFLAGISEKVAE